MAMSVEKVKKYAGLAKKWAKNELASTYEIYDDIGPMDFVKGAGAWISGLAWGLPTLTALTVACNQFGMNPSERNWLYSIYSRGQLRSIGARMHYHTHPAVDGKQPYVFLQNHVNHFDFIVCHEGSPHYRQGIELESHFKYPLYGPFMRSRGTVPVRPGESGQSATLSKRIGEQIDQGRSLLGFPEGGRTLDGRLQPFRRGFFYIARDLGIPIVPVTVLGMFELMRKGSVLIRPGKDVHVYMDAPIPTNDIPDDEIGDLVDHVHDIISTRVDAYYDGKPQPAFT